MKPRSRKEVQLSLPTSPRSPAAVLNPSSGAAWEVRSRAHQSFLTQKPFEEGDGICSRLVRHPEGIAREDYLQAEWTPELAESAMFHWKTKYRKPAPKKEPPFREEHAEELLQDLMERKDAAGANTVYILALMLERKRILIERGTLQDVEGGLVRIYEKKDGGETYMIRDPQLSLNQISEVQQEVALELGWIKPPEEPVAQTENTPAQEAVSGTENAAGEEPEPEEKNSHAEVDNPAQ
jgi:hypothetical protein